MEAEIWKPILEAGSKYEISNKGRVISLFCRGHKRKKPIYLKPGNSGGYLTVALSMNCKPRSYSLHRLIALYFVPNPHNYPDVNHKDGNPLNNSVENLEWCTHQYNMMHTVEVLDKRNGQNHPQSKFTILQIANILHSRLVLKIPPKELAIQYNCSEVSIYNICAGRRYKKEYKLLTSPAKKESLRGRQP